MGYGNSGRVDRRGGHGPGRGGAGRGRSAGGAPFRYDATAPTGWMTSAAADRVQDIAQIGDTVYVAGSYAGIQPTLTGPTTAQAWLAAFDAVTGVPLPAFAPGAERRRVQPRAVTGRQPVVRRRELHLGERRCPQPGRGLGPGDRSHRAGFHAERQRGSGALDRAPRHDPVRRRQLRRGQRAGPQPARGPRHDVRSASGRLDPQRLRRDGPHPRDGAGRIPALCGWALRVGERPPEHGVPGGGRPGPRHRRSLVRGPTRS